MRGRRELLILAGLGLAIVVGAVVATTTMLGMIVEINAYWASGPVTPQPGDPAYDAMSARQVLASALGQIESWVALAAIIPFIGATLLLMVRAQFAGSASATASRVASSD